MRDGKLDRLSIELLGENEMNIEKIALEVAREIPEFLWEEGCTYESGVVSAQAIEFLQRCLAKIGEGVEPFAVLFQHDETGKTTSIEAYKADEFAEMNPRWSPIKYLFSSPAEAILAAEKRVAEAFEKGKADGWIGVDLDGTLAHYAGWVGPDHIGEPIPAMLARVQQWIAEGRTVKIFTARCCVPEQVPPSVAWLERQGLG